MIVHVQTPISDVLKSWYIKYNQSRWAKLKNYLMKIYLYSRVSCDTIASHKYIKNIKIIVLKTKWISKIFFAVIFFFHSIYFIL